MDSISIYAIAFLVVFGGYSAMSAWVNRPRYNKSGIGEDIPSGLRLVWGLALAFSEMMGQLNDSASPDRRKRIRNTLTVAAIHCDPDMIFGAELVYCCAGLFTTVLLAVCFTRNFGILVCAGLVGGTMGALYPTNLINRLAEERQTEILRALPFAIDLIGSAMRAGVDFVAAVRYYVSTAKASTPLAVEFGIVLRSMELGKTRIEAIEEMGQRVQADAFTAFCEAVTHGMEVGASIVGTMKVQAEEMRRVRFNIAERKAARAASAMIFPIAIFIMPAMFLIIGAPVMLRVASSGFGEMLK